MPLVLDEPEQQTGRNVICQSCGLIYHDPPMPAEEMAAFYRHAYANAYHDSETMQDQLAQSRIRFLSEHGGLANLSPALEIGCASGEFLNRLQQQGLTVCGVEPSVALSRRARQARKLEVATGFYENFPQQRQKYGLVCMFHVLEHVADPAAILARIRRELKSDGKLFVIVPTIGAAQLSTVFKTIHPTTFVVETLLAMLAQTGFTTEAVQENGYHLSVLAKPAKQAAAPTFPDASEIHQRVQAYVAKRRQVIGRISAILHSLRDKQNIAIYGAGHNTLDLHRHFDLSNLNVTAIFDADPKKQGRNLLGLSIQPPEALQNFDGSSVIISSYAYQEEVVARLHYLTERGIELVTLYRRS